MTQETTSPIIRRRISLDYSTKGVMTPSFTFEATGLSPIEFEVASEEYFEYCHQKYPAPVAQA
jgi:hypothetical protein